MNNMGNNSAINQMRANAPANTMMYFEGKGDQSLYEFSEQYFNVMTNSEALTTQNIQEVIPTQYVELFTNYMTFMSEISEQGLTQLMQDVGLVVDGYSVLYLDGLSPVSHFEINDADNFRGFIEQFETNVIRKKIEDSEILLWSFGEFQLALTMTNKIVTIALVNNQISDLRIQDVLGLTQTQASIADSSELERINDRYQFNMFQGFLNLDQIARALIGKNAQFEEDMMNLDSSWLMQLRSSVSQNCQNDFLKVVQITPKYVFGYKQIDITEKGLLFNLSAVLEISDKQLAKDLMLLNSHMPVIDISHDALVGWYMGANLTNVNTLLAKYFPLIQAYEFECEQLTELQTKLDNQTLAKLTMGLQFVKGIKSVGGYLFDLDLGQYNDINSIDAFVSVVADDPASLALMAKTLPMVNALDISTTSASLGMISEMYGVADAQIKISGSHIVGFSGEKSTQIVDSFSEEELNENGIMSMSMNYARYMDLMSSTILKNAGEMDSEVCSQMYKSLSVYKDLIGNIAFKLSFNENGFVYDSQIQYNSINSQDVIPTGEFEFYLFEDCELYPADSELINPDGTGSFSTMDYDGQCEIYQSKYTWKQEGKQFVYTETSAQEREYCDEDWIDVDLSEVESVYCDIFRISDSEFECEYTDEEYGVSSIYKYKRKI